MSIYKGYRNEIRCDVIPIDVYHVFLGRPWLFDRGVMHDDRLNTYSLTKDHKKITLIQLSLLKSKDLETPLN